jgi:hypothetical protein
MPTVTTPQSRCRAAVARCDITPPVGIYHRMWGAATHDRATGVHRPLLATLLWLEPAGARAMPLVIVALDHCIFDGEDVALMQRSVAAAAGIEPTAVQIALTHTHAAGLMTRTRAESPGGELIGPYLDEVAAKLGELAAGAKAAAQPAAILYGHGRCNLAAQRDFWDEERQQFVCGLNPSGTADDTLLVARVVAGDGKLLGTLVNYACHPTTLAWQNTLISPDYVGALRETVEFQTGAPCLFLQGASGDLGPREGFVGDPEVADRNGRQVAFAALAALESLPAPGTQFNYRGPVVSGATLGAWQHEPLAADALERQSAWRIDPFHEPLPYRTELPTKAQTEIELARWQDAERRAHAADDATAARDAHAQAERMTRQLWKLNQLPAGPAFPLPITIARLGDADWVFVPGEHYQLLQTGLRQRFPQRAIVVATLTNGWQPGYIPAAETYGKGIYQEQIAVVAAGSAEQVLEAVARRVASAG